MKPVEPTRSTSVLGAFARSAAEPGFLPQPARQNTTATQMALNANCTDFNLPSQLPHRPKSPRRRTRQLGFCHEPRQIVRPIHVVPKIAALYTQPAGARGMLGLLQSIRRGPCDARKHIRMNTPAGNRV